jgi:hypothetical protein
MATYHQGYFKPNNPGKYLGDPTGIVYRSSWELKLFSYLDAHPNVLKWASEETIIPYKSPIDGRWHRYYPDVYVEQINIEGKKQKILIEIKPDAQTRPPNPGNKLTSKGNLSRRYLNEVKTWGTNEAKWKAAQEYCLDRGWTFQIMTEKQLFGK